MSNNNYPSGHKYHHNNDYRDITITDTVNDPFKHIDVTFHSAVGNSLVLNLTKSELAKLVDAAQEYLAADNSSTHTRENYSYAVTADKVLQSINQRIYNADSGFGFMSDNTRSALDKFIALDTATQKKIASQALYQAVEIDDTELLAAGNTKANEAAQYVIDYVENHDI